MSATVTRRNCTRCGHKTRSLTGLCPSCRSALATRPERPCLMCGGTTVRRDRHCQTCTRFIETARDHVDHDEDGLTGGRWVLAGNVLHWQQDEPKKLGRPAGPRPPCGTEKGYQWHRQQWRKGRRATWPLPADDPCGCRAAHSAHVTFRQSMDKEVA